MSMTTANKYELHAQYTTYVGDGSIPYDANAKGGSSHVGKAVMHTGEDTVGLVTNGKEICGKLIAVMPDGFVTVQDEGYCDVPSTGTITYTEADNGVVGSATAGSVKIATAVPATTSVRSAKAIKGDGAGKTIIKL